MFIRYPKQLKGSPRAYARDTYQEDKIPNTKPSIERIDNIFCFLKKNIHCFLKCSTYSQLVTRVSIFL